MKGAAPRIGMNSADENSMAFLLDQYMGSNTCHRGDVIEGVVVSVDPKTILIDIGGKCDATVLTREVEQMSPKQLKALKPGKSIKAYVLNEGDESGAIIVSLARAAQEDDWDKAQALLNDEDTVTLSVVDANKGGVIVRLGRLRGFVPGSQLSPRWQPSTSTDDPNRRWEALLGESLKLRVIEVTPSRNRLILSERKATDGKALKHKILQSLEVGTVEKGIVSNLVPFGAFVNVKGVDGLLHISELSWQRVSHPSEILQVGQEVKVYILDIDLDKGRLGLSLKHLKPDPWEDLDEAFKENQLVRVKIVNLTNFGAFAAILARPGVEGLIHISELSDHPVNRPHEIVNVDEEHIVRIISLRPAERRIAFSLKQVAPGETPEGESTQPSV